MQYFILTEVSECDLLIVVISSFVFPLFCLFCFVFVCACVCVSLYVCECIFGN